MAYEVFISFKNSDLSGNPTKESATADSLYRFLTAKGLRVFFSNVELEFLGKSQYTKIIDEALDSSNFLIAVGSSRENFDSEWVRYEWESFLGDVRSGIKPNAEVFVVYESMSVNELPRQLRRQQAFDANISDSFETLYNFIKNAKASAGSATGPKSAAKDGDGNKQARTTPTPPPSNPTKKNRFSNLPKWAKPETNAPQPSAGASSTPEQPNGTTQAIETGPPANDEASNRATSTPGGDYANATAGEIIQFGGYDWLVLEVSDGKALILSEIIIENRSYHDEFEDITWEHSSLRHWLNGDYYNSFEAVDRARIAESRITNADNPWYDTPGGNDTTDMVFLLSLEEVVHYFGDSGQLADPTDDYKLSGWIIDQYSSNRIAYISTDGSEGWWWLRTTAHANTYAIFIDIFGNLNVYCAGVHHDFHGARPALWLNLE